MIHLVKLHLRKIASENIIFNDKSEKKNEFILKCNLKPLNEASNLELSFSDNELENIKGSINPKHLKARI